MKKTRRRILLLIPVVGVAVVASLHGDSVTLKDGTVVNGVVKQIDGGYDITLPDGKHRFVSTEDAKSIKLNNEGKVSEGNARERLTSLQRSIESERDIDRIIDRYQQFIGMNAGTEAAKLAQSDLDKWRDRKAKEMVKVGHQWLTPADRDASLVAAARSVEEVNTLISANRLDDASAMLRQLSESDPENVSYQYLNGVLQLRREQYFEAKRSFDAVAERIDNHAPTILNLAVLAVQFKRWPQAVTQLEQAMLLAPASQEVLDDVLELEQLAPESTRRTGSFERLVKRSIPFEAALEQRQARRGLYRFGSMWVDKATLDKAKADHDAFEKKKADMDKDYQDSLASIKKSDEQIQLVQRMISRIESESLVQGTNGNVIRREYPPTYWELQRDLGTLQSQRQETTKHVADLRAEADKVKASEPKPPFAGKLSPIDHRGVPVILPASMTTRPTTEPSQGELDAPASASDGAAASQPATMPATMPTTIPATDSRGLFE